METVFKRLLRETGTSQAAIARAARIDQGDVSRFASGRCKPYRGEAKRIAQAIGFEGDPQELFNEINER